MRMLFLLVAIALSLAGPAAAAPDHQPWDALVARYVREGGDGVRRVGYARWAASAPDRAALTGYIRALEAEPIPALPRAEAFAAWANLYNALTVKVILAHYPVRSIRDIRSEGGGLKGLIGPWETKLATVEGRRLSLGEIENDVMRPTFHDPRVHYALNCASVGCPDLRVFHAATLDAELDAAARAYIAHPRGVTITPQGLRLSSIYRWYAADFGDVKAHLARYAAPARAAEIRASARIAGYGYDWSLNGTEPAR